MQADQQQKLSQLIKTSPVLQEDERQAWLAMLPVMNDKQAGDLFAILATPVTKKTIQSGGLDQNDKQPSLRHIANLPTEMSYHIGTNNQSSQQSVSQPVAVKRKPVSEVQTSGSGMPHPDMAQVIKQRLEEKELEAPNDGEPLELISGRTQGQRLQKKPIAKEDPELQSMRKKITDSRSPSLATMPKPQKHTNEYIPLDDLLKERKQREGAREATRVAATAKPVITNPDADPAQEIKSIEDVSLCSLQTLQNQGFQNLNDQLVKLVRKHGYFAVILRFESSTLYKQYLEAGKAWLAENIGEKPTRVLPKAEFEKVADILRNMQLA
ncbi:MAG: hypothetical protein IT410_04625 [Candidatus Doudnabacteria bacterium]|nr:hypothetical protein [Candidatus Doudnabacteria bacterium]